MQETVIFGGTIVGEHHQPVECKVRATKTTLDGDPPIFSDYRIMDSDVTDRLLDGITNYWRMVKELASGETPDDFFHAHNRGSKPTLCTVFRACHIIQANASLRP